MKKNKKWEIWKKKKKKGKKKKEKLINFKPILFYKAHLFNKLDKKYSLKQKYILL